MYCYPPLSSVKPCPAPAPRLAGPGGAPAREPKELALPRFTSPNPLHCVQTMKNSDTGGRSEAGLEAQGLARTSQSPTPVGCGTGMRLWESYTCIQTHGVCGTGTINGSARKSWGTRDEPSSSLSLTHPRRSPFVESFSAFARLPTRPHDARVLASFHERRCSVVDRAMSGTSARAREGIPLTLMLTRAFEPTREDPKSLCV